jgi:NAD(P)-dependent dehydrogenase (short-subunit alcohol dehydrogenase family)
MPVAAFPANSVVVTGSGSGIGAAIAMRLSNDGWYVIGIDRDLTATEATLDRAIELDLCDVGAVSDCMASLRGVRALVHAAGFMRTAALGQLGLADADAMWAVHVRALIVMADILVPAMPIGGRILAIGSRTSDGAAERSQYAATKAALTGLIRSWAIELAPRGITANIIAPAATQTPMLSASGREQTAPVLPPIGRYVQPEEIAAYAAFILSPDAAAITGQRLMICGGSSVR